MIVENSAPSAIPRMPPTIDSVIDSVSTCDMMSRRFAPSALRRPISRVRSLTTISMMFMMTMPPTSSDRPTMPTSTTAIPAVACWKMPSTESDATMPKLSGCARLQPAIDAQRDARFVTRVVGQRGIARLDHQRQRLPRAEQLLIAGRAESPRTRRATGRTSAPFFLLTPTTVNGTPAILICLSSGSAPLNSRSAVPQPIKRDRTLALDLGRRDHPAALGVERRRSRGTPRSRPGPAAVSSSSSR